MIGHTGTDYNLMKDFGMLTIFSKLKPQSLKILEPPRKFWLCIAFIIMQIVIPNY